MPYVLSWRCAQSRERDSTVIEAFNGRFKEEGRSLFTETGNVEELRDVVERQMNYYNQDPIHSSLGYVSPASFVRRLRRGEDDI